ncbi:MAG: hypothetical protein IH895_05625 [Planctomycetes bacterium]|nr:hypothetical protein [Planctomycetota bacterium]
MTTRERTIAKFAIPVMAVGALAWAGTKLADSPLGDLGGELAALQEKYDDKVKEKEAAERYVMHYRRLRDMIAEEGGDEESVARSVGDLTKEYIRRRTKAVLADSNLTVGGEKPPALTKGGGRGRKKKIDLVTFTVEGRGDLKDIMQFLLDLYRLDDLLYVSSVDLRPDKRLYSSKVGATIKIQTLIIPHKKKWDKLAAGAKPKTPPDEDGKQKMGRLGAPTMAAYDIFQNWRPFDPVRPEVEPPIADTALPPPGRDKEPVNTGDPERDNKIVRGFMNDSVLVVKKAARPSRRRGSRPVPEEPPTYFNVGEEFDGGTLELVHRLGLVVSKTEDGEEEGEREEGEEGEAEETQEGQPSNLWAYQYGESFSQSRPLDELIKEFGEFRQLLWAWQDAHEAEQVGPPAPANEIKLQAQADKQAAQESSNELSKSSN